MTSFIAVFIGGMEAFQHEKITKSETERVDRELTSKTFAVLLVLSTFVLVSVLLLVFLLLAFLALLLLFGRVRI